MEIEDLAQHIYSLIFLIFINIIKFQIILFQKNEKERELCELS